MTVFRMLCVCALLSLAACASTSEHKPGSFQAPVQRALPELTVADRPFLVDDPWEDFNRNMYRFNARLDRYVYLPVLSVYEQVLPVSMQNGISNVFNNFKEIPIFVNSVLQAKGKKASVSLGRFLTNSLFGLGGIIDVVGNNGLHQEYEDFGQTLGFYGVSSGPYLVLPIFGPSGVRDTGGLAFDALLTLNPSDFLFSSMGWAGRSSATTGVYTVKAVDARHQVKFRYFETGNPFEYALVRFLYTKKRELDIEK